MVDVARYLHIRSAHAPSFTADGNRLVFLLNTTGVAQVWSLDAAGAWPEQLTFGEEPVSFVDPSPTRRELVYGTDEGGDERQQIYLLDAAGGEPMPLTDRPEAKHWWGGWDSDGDRFAFTANRRDEATFDVYVQPRTGDEAELVREGDGWLSVAGWSPDDSRLVVHQAYSNYDMDVYVLHLDSGELRHVTPHEGDVRYGSVEWAPTGDALYLTTDRGADTTYLGRLDLDGLDIETVVEGGDWNVEGVTIDEATGRLAYLRNVDGYSELTVGRLTDALTVDPYTRTDLPRGVYGGIDFSPEADRLALTVTRSVRNANVYVVETEPGRTARWSRASTAGVPPESFVAPTLIRYQSFDDREIPSLFSVPEGNGGDLPTIVDIHGGPESQRRPSFSPITQYFLASGYAVFEPNVRGSTGYGKAYTRLDDRRQRMDAVADLDAGVDWLGRQPAVDTDRIVAMGGSYGGFMVLAALTEYPERWAAGVDIVGIANFITFLQNTGDWRRKLREAEYGSLGEDRDFLAEISPINNIDRIAAPLLVLHGANDPRVPVDEADQIAREAAKHVPVEKRIFEDEGHGFAKLENRIEAYRTIVDFLDEHV